MEGHRKGLVLLKILLAIALMDLVWPCLGIREQQPSVEYVTSTIYGNFFIAWNMTIERNKAKTVMYGLSGCTCKKICIGQGSECMAWSFVQTGGITECRLANEGPNTVQPFNETTYERATYFFKEASISGTYKMLPDNILYLTFDDQRYSVLVGTRKCNSIPGHRVIIPKTKKMLDWLSEHAWQYGYKNYALVNLRKVIPGDNSQLEWGDGSPFELPGGVEKNIENPAEQFIIIIYQQGQLPTFHDVPDPHLASVVCQANPLGVEW